MFHSVFERSSLWSLILFVDFFFFFSFFFVCVCFVLFFLSSCSFVWRMLWCAFADETRVCVWWGTGGSNTVLFWAKSLKLKLRVFFAVVRWRKEDLLRALLCSDAQTAFLSLIKKRRKKTKTKKKQKQKKSSDPFFVPCFVRQMMNDVKCVVVGEYRFVFFNEKTKKKKNLKKKYFFLFSFRSLKQATELSAKRAC